MVTRRTVLAAGLAASVPCASAAAAIAVPEIDSLALTLLADSSVSSFATPIERPGLKILPPERTASSFRLTLRGEWGYCVLADAVGAGKQHQVLIDFGYTPETLSSNMALLGVDPATVDAMVLSHGHYDHFGGLAAVVGRVRHGTPLYVGGEEVFCARLRGVSSKGASFGQLDKADLVAAGIDLRVTPTPCEVGEVGFVTGKISFVSPERPKVPTTMLPGQGCRRDQPDADRRDTDFFVDDAVHELATAFHLKGKGLVVIGSCSHRGIINTVHAAQAASGIDKIHAIVGGFHLLPPQTPQQALQTLAMMQALKPDYIIPGHCTGEAFIAPAIVQMPDQVFRTVVGSRMLFG